MRGVNLGTPNCFGGRLPRGLGAHKGRAETGGLETGPFFSSTNNIRARGTGNGLLYSRNYYLLK